MKSLQEYIVEVSSELIKRAADKADSLSKEGPKKIQDFRIKQAERLYDAYKKKLNEEEKERILKDNSPKTREELRLILETRLEKDKNVDLNNIDVSNVTDMSQIFIKLNPRNIKIDKWNVSNVTNMSGMFFNCDEFKGKGIENWNVSNVKDMSCMFLGCKYFFNADISNWNVSNVTNMKGMFGECRMFNGDLGNWDVSNVKDMEFMFKDCLFFEGKGLENWKIFKKVYMFDIFADCPSITLPTWYKNKQ